MATLEQLQSKIAKLQQQADVLLSRKTQAAVQQIHHLMDVHGLTTADIDAQAGVKGKGKKARAQGKKGPVAAKGKLPAKYLNPETGETWSGRARPPTWIKDAEDRSVFLINGADAVPAVEVKEKRSVPPKYRDPKSGATWTGRGLAPKWIAAAKNRNRFLIDRVPASTAQAPAQLH